MNRSGLQRLVPVVLVLIVVGLIIAALVSVGRTFFGGNTPSPSTSPQVNAGKQALTSTLADRNVRMIVRGPLVAEENFHSYVVTIGPSERNLTTYQGYSGQVVDTLQLGNTSSEYEQFVYALSRAKLMDGTPFEGDANDTRGICATGVLYEFDVRQGTNVIQSLWASSCAGSPGSLKANLVQVQRLFQVQVPNIVKYTSKINL